MDHNDIEMTDLEGEQRELAETKNNGNAKENTE